MTATIGEVRGATSSRRTVLAMFASRGFVLLTLTVVALLAGYVLRPALAPILRDGPTQPLIAGVLPEPIPLSNFGVRTVTGQDFGLDQLRGRVTLLAAGYTNCPDVCPITVLALRKIAERWRAPERSNSPDTVQLPLQTAFLGIDPGRDSAVRLRDYLLSFDKDIAGLTGSDDEIQSLARQLGLFYEIRPNADSSQYLVDHTTSMALIDGDARLVALLPMPHDAEEIATLAARFARPR